MSAAFPESELILTPDNRVYHINLRGEDVADDVIVVGDPDRVAQVSAHFDKVDFKTQHREFVTHTGWYKGRRITALSTGIGVDNIDIVVTELDAAVNIDLEQRQPLPDHRSLNIIRLGTCGTLQADIPVDSLLVSSYGIGMDGLLNFYDGFHSVNEDRLSEEFIRQVGWPDNMAYPYAVKATPELLKRFSDIATPGITATAVGFYGPQGRKLRLSPAMAEINDKLTAFRFGEHKIVNFEMETSALYGLTAMLGHNHLTICTVIANRLAKKFTTDLHKGTDDMIRTVLDRLVR